MYMCIYIYIYHSRLPTGSEDVLFYVLLFYRLYRYRLYALRIGSHLRLCLSLCYKDGGLNIGQHEGLHMQRIDCKIRSNQPLLATPIPWDPLISL